MATGLFDPDQGGLYWGCMARNGNRNLAGIGFMVLGMLSMGGVDAFGKWFVSADYSPIQVIALRGWIITVVILAWALASGRANELTTRRPLAHGMRILVSICGPLFMFTALASLPLADVTVVKFGSPCARAASCSARRFCLR